jgi:alpha-galactosidase
MSEATRNIIMNKEMIAIDQDTLGVQGLRYCDRDKLQFWFKPLAGGDWAFTILNPTREDISLNLNWQDFNLTDSMVSTLSTSFDTKVYQVYNLWTHKKEGKTSTKNKTERKLTVKGRDVISYRLCSDKK